MKTKKWVIALLILLLVMPLMNVPHVFAEEAPEFRYELSVDGEDVIEVNTGDVITVTLYLYRTDSDESYPMYGMQDEIRYDSDFFELVEDSAILSEGIDSTDISVGGSLREFYMSFVDMSGGRTWKAKQHIGSFQLRVIATSGMTTVTNEDYKVAFQDGMGSYECQANELTVILNTNCVVQFESNGGTPIDPANVIYGRQLPPPEDPTQEGYKFDGWFKDFRLTEPWNFDEDIVERNMRLYAKWEPVETEPPETEPPETETDPPVTEPPETKPPETEPDPPVTEPPETDPPETNPPETNPPETETDPPEQGSESGIETETEPPEQDSETETKPAPQPEKTNPCLLCGNPTTNNLCTRCSIVTWACVCILSLLLFVIIMYCYFRFNNKERKK